MSILANDLAAIFADTAMTVSVVFGAQTGRGFLRRSDAVEQVPSGNQLQRRVTTVLVPTSTFTGLAVDAAITVDAVNYVIRETDVIGDGALTRIILAAVAP